MTFGDEALDIPFLGGFNRPKIQWIDWDNDTDSDLFILDASGYIRYLENQGSVSTPDFHLITTSYQDIFCGGWFYFSDYDSDRRQEPGDAPKHRYDAEQYSYAIYGQTNINWSEKLLSVFGLRMQRVDLSIGDIFDSGAPGASGNAKNTLRDIQYHYAANIGLEWEIENPYTFFR